MEDWGKKKRAWDDAQPRAFQLVLSHCEPTVIDKIEASSKWQTIKKGQNVIELLALIQGITQKHDEVKQGTMAFVEQLFDWCLHYQKEGEDLSDFFKRHKSGGDIIDSFGGKCGYHPVVFGQHKDISWLQNCQRPPISLLKMRKIKPSRLPVKSLRHVLSSRS